MRKNVTILIASLLFAYQTYAGYGYGSDCAASIQLNGKTFNLGNCSASTNIGFDNHNFGIVGALTLEAVKQKTFENGADNVNNGILYYRIYAINASPTSFVAINLTTISSLGNGEELRESTPAINLLSGLQNNTAYIVELYLQSTLTNGTNFDLKNNGNYFKSNFTITNILPVVFSSFTTSAQGSKNIIKFGTVSEHNLTKFTVLRSNNGNNFIEIGTVNAQNSTNGYSYTFNDENPLSGSNFYMIICSNLQGEKTYSKIIRNYFGRLDNSLSLFPNPTVDYLKVNFVSNVRGKYKLDMYNDAGQLLYTQQFNHTETDKTISLDLPKSMKKGPYRIYISNGMDFYVGTFIVQ